MPATLYLSPTNNNLVFPLPICQRANEDPDSFSKLTNAMISVNEARNLCIRLLGKDKKETRKIIHKFLDIDLSEEESDDDKSSTQIPNKAADTTTNTMDITYIEEETGEDDWDEKKEG
eukprot:10590142-Ditylum_brightwellii.AAC.1